MEKRGNEGEMLIKGRDTKRMTGEIEREVVKENGVSVFISVSRSVFEASS